ncbi:MAG TPA: acetylxylan esterase [Acidimicrobiales bacterium]|nr:acetylxylan esterase [Acidimicrobiales bacterium]
MYFDLHGDELWAYRSEQQPPEDFERFWDETLAESRTFEVQTTVVRVDSPLRTLDVYDVRFPGYLGQPIAAWLRVPAGSSSPLPTVVEFVGYGGGRGLAEDAIYWPSCGFAHFHVDTRGQGSTWSLGATPDDAPSGPHVPGMMTVGIEDPSTYYYRRLITDCVRAVDAAATLEVVDAGRIATLGTSQGGGLSLAVGGLSPAVRQVVAYVPFLCDFPRAVTITDSDPYREITRYLAVRRRDKAAVLRTLSYFDGVNFARLASVPAFFTTSLMDQICPPSTVMGAYQAYAGPKEIRIWEHNGHEGGARMDDIEVAELLREL